MTSRHGMIRTTIALGIAFALAAPLTASAQAGQGAGPGPAAQGGAPPAGAQGGGRGRGGPPPYTPAAGARDLRSVLHNWGWHRSEEHTSELQSPCNLVCRLLLEKKKTQHRSPETNP